MTTPLFLTSQQVSERWAQAGILGRHGKPIAVSTLAFWRNQGTGPTAVKTAGVIRYPIQMLRAYERKEFGQECDIDSDSEDAA